MTECPRIKPWAEVTLGREAASAPGPGTLVVVSLPAARGAKAAGSAFSALLPSGAKWVTGPLSEGIAGPAPRGGAGRHLCLRGARNAVRHLT